MTDLQLSNLTNTLCKEERLCGKQVISNLFDHGTSFFQSPYRVFWTKIPETYRYPIRFAVSVPKRRMKRAVKRNLIKRRTREAFRTGKQILNTAITSGQLHLMFVYVSDNLLSYAEIEASMKKILLRINASNLKHQD